MRNLFGVSLIGAMLLVSPMAVYAELVAPSERVMTRVVIRAEPDGESEDIGSLRPVQRTNLHGEVSRWYKVRLTDGRDGYVSKAWTIVVPGSDTSPAADGAAACGGVPMTVRFFNAGQALAALLQLPDGRNVMVDTGESATRPACGECSTWSARVLSGLDGIVGTDNTISMLWITHQHSDHQGNAVKVLENYDVEAIVTNGTRQTNGSVKAIQNKAKERGSKRVIIDPSQTTIPIPAASDVKFTAVVPDEWTDAHCEAHPNDCSIGLRIDYCNSSVLFTGDAEEAEEAELEPGDINLLQVGHHGSDTSSSLAFLAKAKPEYAVISTAEKGEGTNLTYCHPRASTVTAVSTQLGDTAGTAVEAFDAAVSCKNTAISDTHWNDVPASKNLYVTARDGDVVLRTTGDGIFTVLP